MLVHWIWLATRPCMHDRVKVELLGQFQDPETVFYADKESYDRVEGLTPEGKDALADKNLRQAQKILEDCERKNLRILTYADAAYPRRLQNIADPPLVFYYKGRLPDFDGQPLIGVVGTRSATPYGMTVAKRLGYQITKCGGVVVSGMASGIDGVAMKGALTAGGSVVGVLGCGADIVYPLSNRSLFEDTERYGCILSEFPPGTPPMKYNFPKRNRIISGLSCGVLVVEAPEKSGALITAHQAADQGRDVFVVPGNIDMPSCIGSNRLLRDGAIAISSGWDILSEYEALFPDKIHREDAPAKQTAYAGEAPEEGAHLAAKVAQKPRIFGKKSAAEQKVDKKTIDNEENSPYIDLNNILTGLSPEERSIVTAIGDVDSLVDDVIARAGLPAGRVLAMLTMLEVKGVVRRLPGRRIAMNK
ncbi:MAG: DNA-processing protein DprA [Oscillospiraceae bacterium]|nr:DNA-processing protein DprA [Oscillospiraceae bacterium]